jgi:hypothetical protein
VFWKLKEEISKSTRLLGNYTSQDQLVYRKLIRRTRGIQRHKSLQYIFNNKRDCVQTETNLDRGKILKNLIRSL